MPLVSFLKKHREGIIRVLSALIITAVTAAFVIAFRSGVLPYSSDGDAFDTIYAIEEN